MILRGTYLDINIRETEEELRDIDVLIITLDENYSELKMRLTLRKDNLDLDISILAESDIEFKIIDCDFLTISTFKFGKNITY